MPRQRSLGSDYVNSFFNAYSAVGNLTLRQRQQQQQQQALLANQQREAKQQEQSADIKMMNQQMTLMADKNLPEVIKKQSWNAFTPLWNKWNEDAPVTPLGEDTPWPKKGSKIAKEAQNIWNNKDYDLPTRRHMLIGKLTEAQTESSRVGIETMIGETEPTPLTPVSAGQRLADPITGEIKTEAQYAPETPPKNLKELLARRPEWSEMSLDELIPKLQQAQTAVTPKPKRDPLPLVKAFTGDQRVKTAFTVNQNFQRVNALVELAGDKTFEESLNPADQGIITAFMKMLDPGSVVRESEFARLPENMSIINSAKAKFSRWKKGGILASKEREVILKASNLINVISEKERSKAITQYTNLATEAGVNPELVVGGSQSQDKATRAQQLRQEMGMTSLGGK